MSNKVTYSEIIEALSRKTGFSKQKSEAFAKALIRKVKQELEDTGKASITNFGSFKVKEVAERQGQNPQTGEPITIPAHKRVSFTPYKALREEVNAKFAHLETELLGEKEKDGGKDKEEEKVEPVLPISSEEKQEEPEEKVKDTIFQFDDGPEEDEVKEEKTEDAPEDEPELDDTRDEDPFVFDMPDEHEEEEKGPEPEPELEQEMEKESESISDEPFVREGKKESSRFGLILIVAALLAVALVSVWWFFLRTEPTTMPAQQAVVEQPTTTQPANNQTSASVENSEAVQETNYGGAVDQVPEQNEASTASAATAAVEKEKPAQADESNITDYTVKKNEWYWVIGKKVYGKSQFWPLIYQANFTMDTHPDSLADNTSLQVPALEGTAANPTKADYLRLAEASQMVSDAYKKFGLNEKAGEYARFAKKWQRLGS
ncbi:HU family DNA-binding protein [Gracilimonas sp. BCB1]|uniref:HU family DNA-binding protein n=1 Tax=Gracilimonas sp. BCB1 TaxID=3152362 RepID=UPI0032D95DAC